MSINTSVIDRQRLNFSQVYAGQGLLPEKELHALDWGELLQLRNGLNRAINDAKAMIDSGEEINDERADAFTYLSTLVDSVGMEVNYRDSSGQKGPRPHGRRTAPDTPGQRPPAAAASPSSHSAFQFGGGRRFADMWPGTPRDHAGFDSLNDFLNAVWIGDKSRFVNAGMSEGIGPDGGFLVPPGFAADLLDAALEMEIVRPIAMIFPMNTSTLTVPVMDIEDRSGGKVAGLGIQWLEEAGTGTNQKGKVRPVNLRAKKGGIWVPVTSELVEDGVNFHQQISNLLVKAVAFGLDASFISGSGTGAPLGALNDKALITVPKETGQTAGTLLATNILKMYSRMHAAGHANAVWMVHPNALPQLMTLHMDASSGSTVFKLDAPDTWLTRDAGGMMRLLGRPVAITEKVPALGTAAANTGCLLYADWSQYLIGIRRDIRIEVSVEAGWLTDELGFRVTVRVDGMGTWSQAHKPLHGTDTLSWAVAYNPA